MRVTVWVGPTWSQCLSDRVDRGVALANSRLAKCQSRICLSLDDRYTSLWRECGGRETKSKQVWWLSDGGGGLLMLVLPGRVGLQFLQLLLQFHLRLHKLVILLQGENSEVLGSARQPSGARLGGGLTRLSHCGPT